MLVDPVGLRCVELAAAHLNFREAAARAALSPAAFGERIRQVEEELGVKLFVRTTRSVRLTADGERLLPQIRVCLEELRALHRLARADRGPEPVTLTLGTRWELGLSWLVPSLSWLRERQPGRTLHLTFGDSPELLELARRGRIDGVITSFRVTTPDLLAEPLHEERYAFVGAPSLLGGARLLAPNDARAFHLLDTQPDLPLFRYLLDASGGEPWPFAGTELLGAIGAVRARALEGAGLAVLPRYFIEQDLAEGRLVALLPELPLPADHFRLWWRRGHPQATQLRTLAEDLRALPLR